MTTTPDNETTLPEVEKIQAYFPDAVLEVNTFRGDIRITVQREKIAEICTLLRDDNDLQYNFFSECLGVDYLDRFETHRFEVVYNLYSLRYTSHGTTKGHNRRVFLKVRVPEDDPVVPTVTHVYNGATLPEREVFDFFGIRFQNHPDLRRLFMSDDWIGHPQRKDYPLGGERVQFPDGRFGPAVSETPVAHPGESYHGCTGDVQGEKQTGSHTPPPVPQLLPGNLR